MLNMAYILELFQTVGLSEIQARWCLAVLAFAGTFLFLIGAKKVGKKLVGTLEKKRYFLNLKRLDRVLDRTTVLFYAAASALVATLFIEVTGPVKTIGRGLLYTVIFIQFGLWGNGLIEEVVSQYRQKLDTDPGQATGLSIVNFIGRTIVWTGLLLLLLENLGVDITALLASLGIGGVAVALAAQNVLGDLFASLSIVIDRPFELGDFIIVGDQMGEVERVGLKTTRVRSLGGEELVFSNQDLLQSRIQNYKRMEERRIRFTFGVLYSTPSEDIEAIPGIVGDIIGARETTRFDRAHFIEFGESSLVFEVVYYVLDRDYNVYRDIHEAIILNILKALRERDVEFAFPTRSVHLESTFETTETNLVE